MCLELSHDFRLCVTLEEKNQKSSLSLRNNKKHGLPCEVVLPQSRVRTTTQSLPSVIIYYLDITNRIIGVIFNFKSHHFNLLSHYYNFALDFFFFFIKGKF